MARTVDIYVEALGRLGIFPKVTTIDDAQYQQRTNSYDFDMAWYTRALSLSPGNEQFLYWGAKGVEDRRVGDGTRSIAKGAAMNTVVP